jgi:hypothetical protein
VKASGQEKRDDADMHQEENPDAGKTEEKTPGDKAPDSGDEKVKEGGEQNKVEHIEVQ